MTTWNILSNSEAERLERLNNYLLKCLTDIYWDRDSSYRKASYSAEKGIALYNDYKRLKEKNKKAAMKEFDAILDSL